MSRTLYLECCSGISGDMTVGALLDLGADTQVLMEGLESLGLEGYEIHISRVKKSGLDVCDFDVRLDKHHENHDHDMEYLHGEQGESKAGASHVHEKVHDACQGHVHSHEHRGLTDIFEIFDRSKLTPRAKETARKIFRILGEAEAKAHGVSLEQVHFHEVGAVDSIVDIAAAAICLDNLDITQAAVSELYEGSGLVRCQHGMLPVPVPAVANITAAHGLPLHVTSTQGELVTPTGAAIAAAVRTMDRLPAGFTVERVGMGAGKRSYDRPSILRAMLIEPCGYDRDVIYKLESNIDDCTGEALGFLMEELLKAGARDVNYMPVYMKKNRPAYQLNVLCTEPDIQKLENLIFQETTTIGVRRVRMERTVLNRREHRFTCSLGEAGVKVCSLMNGQRVYPEYEDVARLSREHGLPFLEVYARIQEEYKEH